MQIKFFGIFLVLSTLLFMPTGPALAITSITGTTAVNPTSVQTTAMTPLESVSLFPSPLSKGAAGSSVTDLQTILKTDPFVYPEGLVTGYYGSLTESAVKRLQEKYGLPTTGVLDQNTTQIIYPTSLSLTLITPNGGEVWDKSQLQTILWKSSVGPVASLKMQSTDSSVGTTESVRPFFTQISLTLTKDSNPNLKYHIGTADVYQSSYSWKIPAWIPEAKDYRVRISAGGEVPCLYRAETQSTANTSNTIAPPYPCPMMYPINSASDVSDNAFAITGSGGGGGTNPEIIQKMKAVINEMEASLNNLLRQIQTLKSLLGNL